MHQVGKSEDKKHYKSYKVNMYINLFWTTKGTSIIGFFPCMVVILHIFDVQSDLLFQSQCLNIYFYHPEISNLNLKGKGKAFCFENGGKV